MFEIGDLVVIKEKHSVARASWVKEMDETIGKTGEILAINKEEEIAKIKCCDVAYESFYYSFKCYVPFRNFKEGQTVKILGPTHSDIDPWTHEMDKYIGKAGVVTDCVDLIRVMCGEENLEYWYEEDSLKIISSKHKTKRQIWYMGPDKTVIFKLISEDDGLKTFSDKWGRTYNEENITIIPAPLECKSFDFVYKGK